MQSEPSVPLFSYSLKQACDNQATINVVVLKILLRLACYNARL